MRVGPWPLYPHVLLLPPGAPRTPAPAMLPPPIVPGTVEFGGCSPPHQRRGKCNAGPGAPRHPGFTNRGCTARSGVLPVEHKQMWPGSVGVGQGSTRRGGGA